MSRENALTLTACGKCKNPVEIDQSWTSGGMNDYGGFVLECDKCGDKFVVHVGKDVNDSRVRSGATLLDRYDDEVNNRDEVLARHGLK